MKTIQEINELLQEGKTEEAYKEVTEYYNVKKDDVSLLYLTLLDLDFNYYTLPNYVFIERFEKLIKSNKKQIRQRAYEPYLSLLLDIEDYEKCYNVSSKARQEGLESFLINLGYAKGSIEYKEIKTEEIENILLGTIDIAPNDQVKKLSQTYICEYYCKNKRFEEVEKFVHKIYFTYKDGFVHYLNMIVDTYKNPESKNTEQYEKAMESDHKYETLMFLANYYYFEKHQERALEYLEELLIVTNNDFDIQKKKTICLLELERIEEATAYLLTLDQNNYDVCYLLGKILYNKRTRKDYNESKQYFFKALDINPNVNVYNILSQVCEETRDFTSWSKLIEHLKKSEISKALLYKMEIKYYNNLGDFDKALALINELGKYKTKEAYLAEYSYCSYNPNKLNKYFKKLIKEEEYDFFFARAKLYGYYGLKIDKTKLLPFIKNYETECFSSCVDSLIAKYYLDENDIENGLKHINRGLENYNKNIDMCTCVVGYYAYCLVNGIGYDKDIKKAYDLMHQTIEENYGCVSESLGNLYAECAILLNKDLNNVYEFLIKTIERRYTLGRYFMIIKVGKLLNKDVSYYEKMYKESFKYENKLECQYYKNNPETFMMNNF